uniref:Small ribosomal subunit protein uS7c n=1 Tax=Floydiella terrestris TaxID=51328 RepID=E2DSI9_FLOTE|nr:ribosomal protein S7 [Floydiella terrestris]ACZ58460.1 ribosomal protein S7 [Floydiella terrestris]
MSRNGSLKNKKGKSGPGKKADGILRKSPIQKRVLLPDPVYNSLSVQMLVNRVLKSGKKSVAYRIVYSVLKKLSESTNENPVFVWEKALSNVQPRVEIKPRRRGGAIQQVPYVVHSVDRAQATAIRWVLLACQKRSGKDMITKLLSEILEASKKSGAAFRKKEELHKTALANQMNARKPEKIVKAIMDQDETTEKVAAEQGKTNTAGRWKKKNNMNTEKKA